SSPASAPARCPRPPAGVCPATSRRSRGRSPASGRCGVRPMAEFEPILTARWGDPEATGIDGYLATGGYRGLTKALAKEPDDVIAEVKSSGLRGRGGAGFPTGQKWSFVPQNTGKPVYVVCNFDESEPGTFNNRELVERDPHQLIEGLIIASYAVR